MTDCCKRRKVEEEKVDRLTDLPINVKHQIQEHLSIEENARLSVLSTSWRHVWASNPKLIFSTQFCKNKSPGTLIDIVGIVLLQHVGPIKTFHLNISSIPSSQHSIIDEWMLLLSRSGIVDLTLHNLKSNTPYKLPSYVYGVELESLDLSNCVFSPPSSFRGFHKLKRISLLRVALKLDIAATSCLWMPNLESLILRSCSGVRHLKIYAPQLLELNFHTIVTDTLKLAQFKDCWKLKRVVLATRNNQDKAMNLINLFSGWPAITFLLLDSNYLKSLCSYTNAERLPTCLNSLRTITFHLFNYSDEVQVNSLLRVLRSFPNLVAIRFSSKKKKDDMEVNVNCFERMAGKTEGLNKLQILTIINFHGSRTELLFLRFILASAPLLLKTILNVNPKRIDAIQCLKISKELMEFPPASPKLQIIFEPRAPSKLA